MCSCVPIVNIGRICSYELCNECRYHYTLQFYTRQIIVCFYKQYYISLVDSYVCGRQSSAKCNRNLQIAI